MKSNLDHWKEMQEREYFETHLYYAQDGELQLFGNDVELINHYVKLSSNMNVVVIGCGYGRESVLIAPLVGHVYGIDVSEHILSKARDFVEQNGVKNFTAVLAERWKLDIPSGVDLVFAVTVFQHLTRDLVKDYVTGLAGKLSSQGKFICQFLEENLGPRDAELKVYEPSVSWSAMEIKELINECSLVKFALDEHKVTASARWRLAYFGKGKRPPWTSVWLRPRVASTLKGYFSSLVNKRFISGKRRLDDV